MTQSEALYYIQPPVGEFTARVLSCTPEGESWPLPGPHRLLPGGGGQPADQGTLGGADVLDVHEKGGQAHPPSFRPTGGGRDSHW